jgi:adenine-specific DNA-methyltransferase
MDFFDYSIDNKFNTIIGNPPYVGYKNISNKPLSKYVDGRGNLCWHFIEKCYLHLEEDGEMIFIVPREFLKATSCAKLNAMMASTGAFTHIFNMGENAFPGFSPNTIIFRYVKNKKQESVLVDNTKKHLKEISGQLIFTVDNYSIPFTDYFFVKVGGASGADKIFEHPEGNKEFVVSSTQKTGNTKRMFYNIEHSHLMKHKEQLLNRKVKKFTESNWYEWGRKFYDSKLPRVYVNVKTRAEDPFFIHNCKNYSGSILGIFLQDPKQDEILAAEMLNCVNWEELGFYSEGRYSFTQRSLENILLPDYFTL